MKENDLHGCGCTVCQNTTEETDKKRFPPAVPVIAAAVLFAAAMAAEKTVPAFTYAAAVLYGLSVLAAGYNVFKECVEAALKHRITEDTLMTIAMVAAFATKHFSEAAMTAILFSLGEILEETAVERSRGNIRKLMDIRPETAHRFSDGAEETVDAREIVSDDIIAVHPFERIPLDGVITDGSSDINASAITGESVPLEGRECTEVLSGMVNGGGSLKIKVTNSFKNSAATKILEMVESASGRKGNAEKFITRFAKVYTPAVVLAAVLIAAVPSILGYGSFNMWLYRSLIFLVASCPCALVISVPLAFYAGIGVQSRMGVLVKGGRFLETLSKAKAVVLDKTGTLTSGKLNVTGIAVSGGYSRDDILMAAAAIEKYSSHPIAKAIYEAAAELEVPEASDVAEKPGVGVSGTVSGKTVLCGRKHFLEEKGVDFGVFKENASVYVSSDGKILGGIILSDLPKPDSAEAVDMLGRLNVNRIVMLTGDSAKSAEDTAKACGINEYKAGLLPGEKLRELEKIRGESGTAVFVGDGINDAPSIAAADCGIAMGLGTDAAIETADVVLSSGKLSSLASAVSVSRRVMRIIWFNIFFALTVKAIVLLMAVLGYAQIWAAVFADVGVCILSVLNSIRILSVKHTGI